MENRFVIGESSWKFSYSHYINPMPFEKTFDVAYLILKTVFRLYFTILLTTLSTFTSYGFHTKLIILNIINYYYTFN